MRILTLLSRRRYGASIETLCAPVKGNLIVSGAAESQKVLSDIHQREAEKAVAFRSSAKGGPVETMLSKLAPEAQERVIAALVGVAATVAAPGIGNVSVKPKKADHHRLKPIENGRLS